MKRAFLLNCAALPMMAFAAAGETGGGEPAAPAPIERQKKNGFTRPQAGTKTGLVWDIADAISAKKGSPALRDEVFTAYKDAVADASDGTISTQYSRWCGFHGVSEVLRKQRAEAKAAADAEKQKEKDAKAAERAKAKEAKDAEKAEKKAAADAKKAAAAKTAKAAADKAAAGK